MDLPKPKSTSRLSTDSRKYDFSASGMSVSDFCRWFSDNTGLGIVVSSDLYSKRLSAEVRSASAEDIIEAISRSIDCQSLYVNGMYYLGKLRAEDRGYLIRKVFTYEQNSIKEFITPFLSPNGRVYVSSDGIVIVSDQESVLTRVGGFLDSLASVASNTWIIQLYITAQKKDININLGGKVNTTGELSYALSHSSDTGSDAINAQKLAQNVNFMLEQKSEFVTIRNSPMLLLRDGTSGYWKDGITMPVPQKTVSPEGTVTISGYKEYETGLIVTVKIRESRAGAILEIDYTDSDIKGYVDATYPIIAKSSMKFNSYVQSGKIYLLGELTRSSVTTGLVNIGDFSRDSTGTRVQLWARVFQVLSPVVSPERKK